MVMEPDSIFCHFISGNCLGRLNEKHERERFFKTSIERLNLKFKKSPILELLLDHYKKNT